ncbi:MAG: hypothetical protein MZW92_31520 [Comamonadaceae bacterium]|nr:hypothetical protein [Comamonadaceae bacterium]
MLRVAFKLTLGKGLNGSELEEVQSTVAHAVTINKSGKPVASGITLFFTMNITSKIWMVSREFLKKNLTREEIASVRGGGGSANPGLDAR